MWDDLELPAECGAEDTMVIRRQLQRVTWQHGCADPAKLRGALGSFYVDHPVLCPAGYRPSTAEAEH